MEPYVIVTGTHIAGVDWAEYRDANRQTWTCEGRGAAANLARRLISLGFDQTRPVRIIGTNGGKLGSARTLAELGRVRG